MKRALLVILIMNIMCSAFAFKYLQNGLSWQHIVDGVYFETQTLERDTVINGKEYLHLNGLLLRDDSTGLYFRTNVCDSDFLMFRYGAEVGDSILIYNSQYPTGMWAANSCPEEGDWEGLYTFVTAVDTILLLNGEPRRRVFYENGWYIEGVGGIHGIKGENFDHELYIPEMLCCYIGDTLLWARNDCEQWQDRHPEACLGYTPTLCADTWHAIVYKWSLVNPSEADDVVYRLASDTVIGDYTYRKLMQNDTICVGGLRQTDNGMKVYYYDMVSPSDWPFSHVDCLLFDFSANVGDTIKDAYYRQEDFYSDVVEPQTIGWRVTAKDTIDGRIYMSVARFDSLGVMGAHHETLWIQGIGTANVIWPYEYGLPGNDSFNTLYTLCAMSGDEILYSYDLDIIGIINNCTEWHFKDNALNDTPSDVTGARKFLRDGHIYISTPIGTFNAQGQMVE